MFGLKTSYEKNYYMFKNLGGKNQISLLNKLFLVTLLCMVLIVSFYTTYYTVYASPQKIVYVVICVDTESTNGHYLNASTPPGYPPTMDVSTFSSSPPTTFNRVFNTNFRNSISDSFGNTFKMTWFTEMDYLYSQSNWVNVTAPAGVSGYTALLTLLQKDWGSQMQTFGDAFEYHHHFEIYNKVWQIYNNGNGPDAGYGDYQMYALDHSIIDNNFYPTTFRSGWNNMSTSLSNWIEQWFPFDYTPTSGGWSPVHAYPGMNHLQTQTAYFTFDGQVQQAFNEASAKGSSIYSFYMHPFDDMAGNITDLSVSLRNYAKNNPDVKYEYVTAAQAMQLASGYTDFTPPTFQVSRNGSTYIVNSSETLWSNNVYVAVSYVNGSYTHLAASPAGTNTWTVNIPGSSSINKIGVAANDMYGNSGLKVFLPLTPSEGPIPTLTIPQTMPPEIQVPVVGVTASSYNSGYSPDRAVDGIDSSLSNYWGTGRSGFPQWLKLDLWSVVPVNRLTTHFFDNDSRTYTYSVDVSSDGSTWTTVVATKVAGGNVNDDFNVVLARYVRLNVLGSTVNPSVDVEEVKVFQPTVVPQPSPTASPSPSPSPTASPSPSPSPTASPSPSPSPSPTASPTPTPTNSSTPTPAVSLSPTPDDSSKPAPSATLSPSPTPVDTVGRSQPVTGQNTNDIVLYGIAVAIVIVGAVSAILLVHKKKV
jgi:hypothetical protein